MGRRLEKDADDFGGKKDRGRRKQKGYLPDGAIPTEELQEVLLRQGRENIINLESRRPVAAGSVHSGLNIPNSDDKRNISYFESEQKEGDEEKLASLEEKISKEFSDAEKKFIDPMIGDYNQYFFEKKKQAERKKVKIDGNWIEAIRQFFIDERKRWGMTRQIAPEKGDLLGRFLDQKLPVGIPEEKIEDVQENSEERKEKNLTIKNKYMEKNIAKLKVQAGMLDQKAEEMHLDEREAIQRNNEVTTPSVPEDILRQKEIRKIAEDIFKKRKDLNPDNQETELSEDDLHNAEGIYKTMHLQEAKDVPSVPTSPAEDQQPYKYAQGDETLAFSKDWQNPQKNSGGATETSPKSKEPRMTIKEELKSMQDQVEQMTEQARKLKEEKKSPEQKELDDTINDFQVKQAQIAEMRAKKAGRWASLCKTLGWETKNINEDPEVMELEKNSHDKYRELMAKGINLYKGDKGQLENFLKQFDEFEVFKQANNQEIDAKAKVAGFPENVLAGLHTLTKKWSELGWKQKVAISMGGGLLFAGGAAALGAGTFGAAAIGAGWRWGFRAFGAGAAGVGRNVMLDRQMMTKMESEAEARLKERMDSLEKYENNLDQGIEDILSKTGIGYIRKDFEQRRTDNEIRALKFARNTFIISSLMGESFRYASQATGINMGSILKKIGEHTGISLGGVKDSVGHFLGGNNISAEHASMTMGQGHELGVAGGGAATGAAAVEHIQPSGGGSKLSPEEFNEIQKAFEANPSGKNIDEIVKEANKAYGRGLVNEAANSHFTGAEAHVSDQFHGGPAVSAEHEVKIDDMRAPDADSQVMTELKVRELGISKIQTGGGIERSAQDIIKANPKGFGLNPDDPRFNSKVGAKAHELAEGLAKKLGFEGKSGFQRFNEIVSHKIQLGETIKVFQDPSTGKFNLTYNGGAFGNSVFTGDIHNAPDVSHHASATEIASSKPPASPAGGQMAVEELKPKTGVAEHQPSRGAGKITGMEEIEARQKIAQDNFARANQHQSDLRAYNERQAVELEKVGDMAHVQQVHATGRLLNRVFEGAGVSEYADILKKPMNEWENLLRTTGSRVSQDVQFNDATNKLNLNIDKLRRLYPLLKGYNTRGADSIGECLFKAMKDPLNVLKINEWVLIAKR